jgi:phenylacetic acid degradation operon negative regulatory protein
VSTPPEGRHGGAKATLYTILGEAVLPTGGSAWTSTLVGALEVLGVTEKNARQALARVGEQGMIGAHRHGREVRWQLTDRGRRLLEAGADRIYRFGTLPVAWGGEWLVAHCPVPETQRALRHQLRALLSFEGFGELAASLALSPHPEREANLRRIIDDLGLTGDSVVLRSRTGSLDADADLVRRAWDLDALAATYAAFTATFGAHKPTTDETRFRSTMQLVHQWRRFPSIDPELPTDLLPAGWAGAEAGGVFHRCHDLWSPPAVAWFAQLDGGHR